MRTETCKIKHPDIQPEVNKWVAGRYCTRDQTHQSGMTFIEVVIALAIVAILAMLAIPAYQDYIDKANRSKAIADITAIEQAIDRYRIIHNEALPDSLGDLDLDTLADPWGNPYQYLNISTVKGNGKLRKDQNLVPINSDYDLYSSGKDGESVGPLTAAKSRDDIIRANNGSFIGLAEDY